jgi:ECF sigma factor
MSVTDDELNLTGLIHRAQKGDSEAADSLFAATYADLRKLARGRLRPTGRNTLLDTSSLCTSRISASPAPAACGSRTAWRCEAGEARGRIGPTLVN